MKLKPLLSMFGVVSVFAGAVVWALATREPLLVTLPQAPGAPSPVTPRAPYDPQNVTRMLQFHAAQVKTDPQSAINRAMLSHWHLERFRESSDGADAARAESAARASLAIRTHNNASAYFELSRALLAQHRFSAALEAAKQVARFDEVGWRQCADIRLELGDYAGAERDLARTKARGDDPSWLALRARMREIKGESRAQIALLQRAVTLAQANSATPAPAVAWFHERLGHARAMNGQSALAERSYQRALRVFPNDTRVLVALAKLHAAQGEWRAALAWGQKAAAQVPAPETLALVGDAYQALGEGSKARAQADLIERIAVLDRASGVTYDRQRALYLADRDLKLDEAVTLARGELRVRRDIYAYDTLAWTLFKRGHARDLAAAASASKRALSQGTRDASLWFHAGLIDAARGQNDAARAGLERALAINPRFHATGAAQARAVLVRLERGASDGSSDAARP